MEGISSALQNLLSALGGRDPSEPGNPYVLGDDGLGCLRDIKRWLQHYDEKKDVWDVKAALASMNIVGNDLCPILASWNISDADNEVQRRICLACVEILVPITWPMELDKDSDDFKVRQYPNLRLAQTNYKQAILFDAEHDILASIMRVAYPSLALPRRERTQRDTGIIRLVIYLLRNLAAIDEDKNRSDTILAFVKANVLDFLCVLASGMGEDFIEEDVIVLDTIYCLLRGVQTKSLFELTSTGGESVTSELGDLLSREKDLRTNNKKQAHTRHNRFGTMISVVSNTHRYTVSSQTAILQNKSANNFDGIEARKKWNRPQAKIKTRDDVERKVSLITEARIAIAGFTSTFLDAGFNPLFLSILKALEHDESRVSSPNRIQFLYLQGWFLRALREQGLSLCKKERKGVDFQDDADYQLVASMMESRATIMLRTMLRESIELKIWKEAHAAMNCLKELLLTIDAMSLSSNSEYQEIAENLQSNLYYEETNLDLVARCVRTYTNQSFGYLDACTDLATVLLKMLEKFASTKTHMYVRARRQRQRKRHVTHKQSDAAQDSDEEEAEAAVRENVKERAFSFAKFEDKFVNEHTVETFLALLEFYADLSTDQIKRIITFLHRIFVKLKVELLLYRLDTFELLQRILNDHVGLPTRNPVRGEVENFTVYMVKRFQKALEESPALAWEVMFEKLSRHNYYLTHEENKPPVEKKAPRPPAEFEIRPHLGLTLQDQIRVLIAILLDENKSEILDWLKTVLVDIIGQRRAWESEQDARRLAGETVFEAATPATETLIPETDAMKSQLFKDGKLRLLLKVIGFERIGDKFDADALWVAPAYLSTETLESALRHIKDFTLDPPTFDTGRSALDHIRRQVNKTHDGTDNDNDSTSSSSSSSEGEDSGKAKTIKKARARKSRRREAEEIDDEQVDAKREKRRELERQRKSHIKSSKYVNESDEESDAEADAIFFAAEAALRERQKMKAAQHFSAAPAEPMSKKRTSKTRAATSSDKENEAQQSRANVHTDSSDEDAVAGKSTITSPKVRKRITERKDTRLFVDDASDTDDGRDTLRPTKMARRNIVDSDDDNSE